MKNKLLVFIYSTSIVISSILSVPVNASVISNLSAVEGNPRFNYIRQARAFLNINDNGIATVQGQLSASSCDSVDITIKLQQYVSGSWKTISTWTETGSTRCSLEKKKAVSSGYSYRVEVVGNVYNANGKVLESHTMHSVTKYF